PPRRVGHGLGHRVVSVRAARAAAEETGGSHPAAGPEAVPQNGVAREFRTGRRAAAGAAHEGWKRITIGMDQQPGAPFEAPVDAGPEPVHHAPALSSASATASNTSRVEAWRAGKPRTGSRYLRSSQRPLGGGPSALSMAIIFSRTARSSSGVAPTMCAATIAALVWPSAQALTVAP